MSSRGDIGDGDPCPLVASHGNMFVLDSNVPKQYCAHVSHDGSGIADVTGHKPLASRAIWPLHGLDDTVQTYMARLHAAVSAADLPDLSGLTIEE